MISADDIEAMKPKRWIKVPGPGQFRGEGEWVDFDEEYPKQGAAESDRESCWAFYQDNKYLPTKTQDEKPVEDEVKPAKYHSLD